METNRFVLIIACVELMMMFQSDSWMTFVSETQDGFKSRSFLVANTKRSTV